MRKLSDIFSTIVDNHHDQQEFMAGEKEVLESIRAFITEIESPAYKASYSYKNDTWQAGILISDQNNAYAFIPFKVVRDHAADKLVAEFVIDPQLKSDGSAQFDLTDDSQKARAVEMLAIETLGQIQISKHKLAVLRHFNVI